jgi:regulatory protein YycH of two-component signal transduction system YycFG
LKERDHKSPALDSARYSPCPQAFADDKNVVEAKQGGEYYDEYTILVHNGVAKVIEIRNSSFERTTESQIYSIHDARNS